jgi:hypothetical protein
MRCVTSNRCPTCGAPTDICAGIRLPTQKAIIFRSIQAAGDIGISSVELLDTAYSGRRRPKPTTIKSHVNQLNDMLVETSFRIVSISKRWVLRRVS